MRRFFVTPEAIKDDQLVIDGDLAHHISRVLRMAVGEEAEFAAGDGRLFVGRLAEMTKTEVLVKLLSQKAAPADTKVQVTLYQGLPKGDKLELIIQKCTELGVSRIVPFQSSRTVVKLEQDKIDKKLERWQKIVQEASQQCKRTQRPQVCAPIELADAGAWRSEQNFVAYEDEALHGGLLSAQLEKGRSVTLVIGPEGGFSPAEIERLQAQGYRCCSLGKRILRAETAAVAAVCLAGAVLEG